MMWKKKYVIVIIVCLSILTSGCINNNSDQQIIKEELKNEFQEFNATIINISNNFSYRPSIYENFIVWSQFENGTYNIHLYNIEKNIKLKITNNKSYQDNPDIYRNFIVWENIKGYNQNENRKNIYFYDSDIILYDITTKHEKKISKTNYTNKNPKIHGDNVIWVEIDYDLNFPISINNIRISIYNIISEDISYIALNYTDYYQSDLIPDIYNNYIVWTDMRNGKGYNSDNPNYDIYLYNLSSGLEIQISTNKSYEGTPRIYGNSIYWCDCEIISGKINSNLYQFDLNKKILNKLFNHSSHPIFYEVSNNYIVWGDKDINIFNISTKKLYTITQDPNDTYMHLQVNPDIYENKVVWEYGIYFKSGFELKIINEDIIQYTEIKE